MINRITFDNFKCLDGKTFNLNKINIFSGYNGRGKSSVMQFILMLSQSLKKDKNGINKLHLNGDLVSLGDYDEILTDDYKEEVGFDMELDDDQCKTINLVYTLSSEDIKVGYIEECHINGEDIFDTVGKIGDSSQKLSTRIFTKTIPQSFFNQFSNIHYISANRLGPVEYVQKKEVPDFHNVGANGCNTINTLSTYRDKISSDMNLENSDIEYTLEESASSWMNYIMNGGTISINGDNNKKEEHSNRKAKSSVLSLDFVLNRRQFHSYNVGFGYRYILSIVVTALIARKDSIVIIENPEAHLHPEAQLRLTTLLAKLSNRGAQVFIETHSEHIVNGFRINALKEKCTLSNEDLSIYFFDKDYDIFMLEINRNGRIPNWPDGFFDQFEREMAEIIELGSKVK